MSGEYKSNDYNKAFKRKVAAAADIASAKQHYLDITTGPDSNTVGADTITAVQQGRPWDRTLGGPASPSGYAPYSVIADIVEQITRRAIDDAIRRHLYEIDRVVADAVRRAMPTADVADRIVQRISDEISRVESNIIDALD